MGDIAIKNFNEQVRNSGTESGIRGADGVGLRGFLVRVGVLVRSNEQEVFVIIEPSRDGAIV
jgi:hypothetical protein